MSAKVTTSRRQPAPPKIKNFSEIAMDTREGVNPYKYVANVDDDNSKSEKSSDTPPNAFDVMKLFRESDGEL